jgi:hypothetical protein
MSVFESLVKIHRSIRPLDRGASKDDLRREVERYVKSSLDLTVEGARARYAEIVLGLNSSARESSDWRVWRGYFANRFVALNAVVDDKVSRSLLFRSALQAIGELSGFYRLQYRDRLVHSASYYSNKGSEVSATFSKGKDAIQKSIVDMSDPAQLLHSLKLYHSRNIKLKLDGKILPPKVSTSDIARAFTVQHLLEDVINEALTIDRSAILRLGWNPARSTIEMEFSTPLAEERIRETDQHWWVEEIADGKIRLVMPTYRLNRVDIKNEQVDMWRKHTGQLWSEMYDVAGMCHEMREGGYSEEELRNLGARFRWIMKYAAGMYSQIKNGDGKIPETRLIQEFCGKMNNLIAPHVTMLDEIEEGFTPYLDYITFESVSPLRRIIGSLESMIPNLSVGLENNTPMIIPEDLVNSHRFFDSLVAAAANIPEKVELIFGWDSGANEMVIKNPDHHMARHLDSVKNLPHLHSDISNEIIASAARLRPTGSGLRVEHHPDYSVMRVPIRLAAPKALRPRINV